MKKTYYLIICLLLFFPIHASTEECVYIDSAWQKKQPKLQKELLNNPSFKGMDKPCFIALLNRFAQSSVKTETATLLSFLKKYCASTNSFDLSVLHAFTKTIDVANNSRLSEDVVKLWEMYNGPIRKKLEQFEERGLYNEADSLYSNLFLLLSIDVYDLLKWAPVKGILGDYNGVAQIFCEISQFRKNFIFIAQNNFTRLLAESDSSDIQRNALDTYKKCSLSKPNSDTLALSKWLSSTCAQFNLYREEENAIAALDRNTQSRGDRLLETAQRRFSNRLFTEAIPPALKSWTFLSTEQQRQRCAVILYQSYTNTGETDSAVAWLKKVKLTDEPDKVNAIVLYQLAGLLEKSYRIINTLPESIYKDTLTIRQLLFEGKPGDACSFVNECTKKNHWRSNKSDMFLWKIRTGIFSVKPDMAVLYLDSINSINLSPSWNYAEEILIYRIAIQRMGIYQSAFASWGQLKYFCYIEKPQDMIANFNKEQWPPNILEFYAATLVEALIKNKLYNKAQYILDLISEVNESGQINYFRGLVYFNLGYTDKAKKQFENIILSKPGSVFAHKARIYLLKLKEYQSM